MLTSIIENYAHDYVRMLFSMHRHPVQDLARLAIILRRIM